MAQEDYGYPGNWDIDAGFSLRISLFCHCDDVCVCVCVCVCFEREKRCASVCVVTQHFPGVAASLCVFDFLKKNRFYVQGAAVLVTSVTILVEQDVDSSFEKDEL